MVLRPLQSRHDASPRSGNAPGAPKPGPSQEAQPSKTPTERASAACRALAASPVLEGIVAGLRTPSRPSAPMSACPQLGVARLVSPAWDAASRAISAPHAAAWALGQLGLLGASDGGAMAPVSDEHVELAAARIAAIGAPEQRYAWLQKVAQELANAADVPALAEPANDLADRLRRALRGHDRGLARLEAGISDLIGSGAPLLPADAFLCLPYSLSSLMSGPSDVVNMRRLLARERAEFGRLSPSEPLCGAAALTALAQLADPYAALAAEDLAASLAAVRRVLELQSEGLCGAVPPAAARATGAEQDQLRALVAGSPYLRTLTDPEDGDLSVEALFDLLSPADVAIFARADACPDDDASQPMWTPVVRLAIALADAVSLSPDGRSQAPWVPLWSHVERLLLVMLVARSAPNGHADVVERAHGLHRRLPADAPGALGVLRAEGRLASPARERLQHWLQDDVGGDVLLGASGRLPGGPIHLLSAALRES
jgi:hypothetical protein